jgi:hypothetical protein
MVGIEPSLTAAGGRADLPGSFVERDLWGMFIVDSSIEAL